MYRARIAFTNGHVFYSAEKATQHAVREMLKDIKLVLLQADSVRMERSAERHASTRSSGWYALPSALDLGII